MRSIALNVLFLLCGITFSVEARGYFGRRPRPQTEENPTITHKKIITKKPAIDPPAHQRPSGCSRRRCTYQSIPVSCRQETFFTSMHGRRCKGCDRNLCQDRNHNTRSSSFIGQLTTESSLIRHSGPRGRQVDRTQLSRKSNSNSQNNNLKVQDAVRNNERFDTGFQNRRNSQTFIETGLSGVFPSELDLLLSRLSGQGITGSNLMTNQDIGTPRRGSASQVSPESLWLRSLRVPVTDDSWASPGVERT